MNQSLRNMILSAIVVISALMHYPHFNKELMSIHVWRQTQTQSTIINFYEEDMNILNPRKNDRGSSDGIFRMEFPLMQWLVACLYKIFGNHIIISRIFMFVIGLFSIIGMYKLLNALFRKTILSLMGAWAFSFSPSFYYYTINPLPDNFALCCSIWGLAVYFIWLNDQNIYYLIGSSLLLGIGALCKLPFIIYYIVPLVHFSVSIRKSGLNNKILFQIFCAFIFSILPLAWYITVIPTWQGNVIVKGLLDRSDTIQTLLNYFQHILFSTLPELLLNYGSVLFFLAGFYFLYKRKSFRDSKFILLLSLSLLCLMYYFFESNAIAKIHDYYLFPFYPLLFILVAYGAYYLYTTKIRYVTFFLLFLLPLTCYFRMQGRWNDTKPGFNKDLLLYKKDLRNAVPNDALVVAGSDESHYIFFYYINKKGWGFHNELTAEEIKSMIEKGARYLYTDSKIVEQHPEIARYLDKLILEKGSIRIFSLKNSLS